MKKLLLTALIALSGGTLPAAITFTMVEVGSDVQLTGSGSANIQDLGSFDSGFFAASITPNSKKLSVGATAEMNVWGNYTSTPSAFGTGGTRVADASSGDAFGFESSALFLPAAYVSGQTLSGSAIFENTSFAELGVTSGTYSWTWGAGANADSMTLNISAVPEPSTYALFAGGVVLAGVVVQRRKQRRAA